MAPVRTHGATGTTAPNWTARRRQTQSEQRITYAEAYRRVLIANPRLYAAYLEQYSRQTGGSHG